MPTFRKTTRDYHAEKEQQKMLHGAPFCRYSPSYDRVWSKAPVIEIAGVKDRFGYDNKNSPLYVKRAEGQVSAAGIIKEALRKGRNSVNNSKYDARTNVDAQTSRNRANQTVVNFTKGNSLSVSDSIELINN